jgi:uncharacterized protein YbaR (Trm112 family)
MAASEVSAELMAILRCPRCRGELASRPQQLACPRCQLGFAVRDGVPNFLLEDAQPLSGERGGK